MATLTIAARTRVLVAEVCLQLQSAPSQNPVRPSCICALDSLTLGHSSKPRFKRPSVYNDWHREDARFVEGRRNLLAGCFLTYLGMICRLFSSEGWKTSDFSCLRETESNHGRACTAVVGCVVGCFAFSRGEDRASWNQRCGDIRDGSALIA